MVIAMDVLPALSTIFGWTYVFCWSVSFYPQLILNLKINSSEAVSVDFLLLNTLGYIAYLTSLWLQIYNEKVRVQFYERFGNYPLLSPIDLVYALHGLLMNLIIASQVYLWKLPRKSTARIHIYTRSIIFIIFLIVSFQIYIVDTGDFQLVDLAKNLAYIKVTISFLKYFPQLYHNYRRGSCHGFSILQIWLDITGGIFSILQLFLDNYINNDHSLKLSEIYSNKGKLGLSLVTFFFDGCFIIQKYWVYGHPRRTSSASMYKDTDIPLV